jgi:hypothetical protein
MYNDLVRGAFLAFFKRGGKVRRSPMKPTGLTWIPDDKRRDPARLEGAMKGTNADLSGSPVGAFRGHLVLD